MAYNSNKLKRFAVASLNNLSSNQWKYEDSSETLTNMMMTGFFQTYKDGNNLGALLQNTDIIYLSGSDGTMWVKVTQITPTVITTPISVGIELPDGNILVGDASNEATAVSMSGRATIDNTGAVALPCTSAQILLGNASNEAVPTPMSGRVAIDNAGTTTLVVADSNIIVGDVANKGQPVAMSGRATIDNTGAVSLPCTDGQILVGDGSNEAQPVAMSGRATIDNTGAVALPLTDGQILVGDGSNEAANVAMSGDVTISNTGVTTIGQVIDSTNQANIGSFPNSTGAGTFCYIVESSGGATENIDFVVNEKCYVLQCLATLLSNGTSSDSMALDNVTTGNPIFDPRIIQTFTAKQMVFFQGLNNANRTINAGDTIRLAVVDGGGSDVPALSVTLLCCRIA